MAVGDWLFAAETKEAGYETAGKHSGDLFTLIAG